MSIYRATGDSLDTLAGMRNIWRQPGESDDSLRARVLAEILTHVPPRTHNCRCSPAPIAEANMGSDDYVRFPRELRDRLLRAYAEDRCEVFLTREEDLVVRYHAGDIRRRVPTFAGMYLLVVDVELP